LMSRARRETEEFAEKSLRNAAKILPRMSDTDGRPFSQPLVPFPRVRYAAWEMYGAAGCCGSPRKHARRFSRAFVVMPAPERSMRGKQVRGKFPAQVWCGDAGAGVRRRRKSAWCACAVSHRQVTLRSQTSKHVQAYARGAYRLWRATKSTAARRTMKCYNAPVYVPSVTRLNPRHALY